ncbi:MAG: glycosyltransferase family 4 protein [Candidatus Aenigmarchaeota archaeon]|nr:glycosyltransferase family 4 protein [Candidatus Aenigmarchaeota archaeon]
MNIGFFCYEYYPLLVGGLGTYAIEITRKIKEFGNDISVFTLNDGNLSTYEIWNGIEIHRPMLVNVMDIFPIVVKEDLRRWGWHLKFFADIYTYNILSATKFVNLLIKKQRRKFDIISFHDWLSAFSGIICKQNTNLPAVFHIHSIEEQRALGGGSETIKEIERIAAKYADKIITVSYSMKDFLVSLGYPKDKIEVVYNGIDTEKYSLKNVNWKLVEELKNRYKIENEKVILFVGRLTWIKGVYNLLRAMAEINKKFDDVKLVILGKGEEYSNLLQLKQQLNLNNVEIYSKWVSEEERIAHYALADLCVFPSINEPFGIVSLEAMSMEKPVVVGAKNVNGLKEQVIPSGENRCGVHVNGEDPLDIAWGIEVVLSNLEEAKKWGKNGRKRVEENFKIEYTAKKTLEIYESLLRK